MRYRSAVTGRYVSEEAAIEDPDRTVEEEDPLGMVQPLGGYDAMSMVEAQAQQIRILRRMVEELEREISARDRRLMHSEPEAERLRAQAASFTGQLENVKRDRGIVEEQVQKRKEVIRKQREALAEISQAGDADGLWAADRAMRELGPED